MQIKDKEGEGRDASFYIFNIFNDASSVATEK